MDSLTQRGLILLALLGVHLLDHALIQPVREVPALSGLVGAAGFAIVAAAIVLARLRSPHAPPAAVFAGLGTVAGFIVVHLLPGWSPISDPYWDFAASPVSWILLIAPMLAARALAVAGAHQMTAHPVATQPAR